MQRETESDSDPRNPAPGDTGTSPARSTRRPWSPIPLVLVALVGGLPGAGALLGINWYRLGFPDRGRKALILFAFLTALGALLIAWLNASGQVDAIRPDEPGRGSGLVFAVYVAQIGVALLVALQQRGPFEDFLARSTETRGLGSAFAESIVVMVLGAVGGILVQRAVLGLAVRLFAS